MHVALPFSALDPWVTWTNPDISTHMTLSFLMKMWGWGLHRSEDLLHSFTLTWKILKTHWNGYQAIKKNEDWWHGDNSTTADLLGRGWDGTLGSVLTYCCCYLLSSILCLCECIKLWKNDSWQEPVPVKAQRKIALPDHQGQGWW